MIALVGMDVTLPGSHGLSAFERALFSGDRPRGDASTGEPTEVLQRRLVRAAATDAGLTPGDVVTVVSSPETGGLASAFASAREKLEVERVGAVAIVASAAPALGAAIVFARFEAVAARGGRVYATVEAEPGSIDDVAAVFLSFLAAADGAEALAVVERLGKVFPVAAGRPPHALVLDPLGPLASSAVTSLVALISAALAVHYRYFPAPLEGARLALDDRAPFFQPAHAHPWFAVGRRRAAVCLASGGHAAHLMVSSDDRTASPRPEIAPVKPLFVMRFAAESEAALERALDGFTAALERGDDPSRVESALGKAATTKGSLPLRLALVGRNVAELTAEAAAARRALPGAIAGNAEWQTPRGSYFTARPLGPSGKVAFVYPGAFSAYVGLGRRLPRLFPRAYERLAAVRADVGSVFAEELVYPRIAAAKTVQRMGVAEQQLATDPIAMIESGMAASFVYTSVLRDAYGVIPAAAFGYSMGELTMLWSLGVWRDGDAAGARLRESPVFRTRLAGPLDAVRAWKRRASIAERGDATWVSYVVSAPTSDVMNAVETLGRGEAFLSIVNGPAESLVAGTPEGCARVLEALRCPATPTPVPHVLHARDVLVDETSELLRLTTVPVHDVATTTFYSAAEYAPLALESGTIARTLVHMCQERLDFGRLVRRVYDDGARIFVELGPAGTCTRLVGQALEGREHLAVAIDRRGADEEASVAKVIARLYAHRVPMA